MINALLLKKFYHFSRYLSHILNTSLKSRPHDMKLLRACICNSFYNFTETQEVILKLDLRYCIN